MEDEASTSLDGKVLGNLRVVDLKQELEKRGLSKSGSKKDLVKRLKQQLEFEKLCEERKSSGDFDRKLELDADIEQNEFVQQYLAQQKKRYAERKEAEKKLELEVLQKQGKKEPDSSENQMTIDKNESSDVDEDATEAIENIDEPSKREEKKNIVNKDKHTTESFVSDERSVTSSDTEDEESTCPSPPSESENIKVVQSRASVQPNNAKEKEHSQENANIAVDNPKNEKSVKNISPPSSPESEVEEPQNLVKSNISISVVSDNVKELTKISAPVVSDKVNEQSEISVPVVSDVNEQSEISVPVVSDVNEQSEISVPVVSDNEQSEISIPVESDNVKEQTETSLPDISDNFTEQIKTSIPVVSDNVKEQTDISIPAVPDNVKEQTDISVPVVSDNVKKQTPILSDNVSEQTDSVIDENVDNGDNENPKTVINDLIDFKDNEGISPIAVQSLSEQCENTEPQSNILSEDDSGRASSLHTRLGRLSSSENLCKESLPNMEPSECSSVPYSLSDIQLPESPGHLLKAKEPNEGKNSKTGTSSEIIDPKESSDLKTKSNGVAESDTLNSNEKRASESETKENMNCIESPEKSSQKNESEHNQQDESSDVDSDKNNSPHKKKSIKKDVLPDVAMDHGEENSSKEQVSKEQTSLKHPHQSEESDDDKSSDSGKYKSSRLDSRRKSHGKHRKRNRHSRSRSSSSSSSRSSDSSPKRRHSKKSVISTKTKKIVENYESNQICEKSSDDKPEKLKNEDSLVESSSSLASKKKLKIKRDNVSLEANTASHESLESTSSRSIDNITSSVSQGASDKPPKPESTEDSLSFSDLSYVPRKVSLANRKFNRKSSEEHSNEPKSKKSKWESFAAAHKVSQTISISTDSLKTWFPDFKLMSEPSSTMELEPDEHSSPPADEKESFVNTDVSNVNDNGLGMKDTVSHVDVEDSESQEPKFEDASEQGPTSKILFIQNLVRPFTLNQLKDLLKQNGKLVEEYFWIDKIKSKCFVMYETEKEAIKAKNALNNTRWPSSNPKILSVNYSNEEEMEQHKKGNEPQPKPVIEPLIAPEIPEVIETRISHPVDEHKRKDRERRKERERSKPMPPVREWDKDKVIQDSPEREHIPKEEKSRNSDKKEKKESKKRPNEDTPAKLLDDLFQKTKNPPCIYWLPLTEEQAKQKDEAQKMRKLEREKRNQQMREQEEAERRNKRARSSRRSREKENHKSSTRSRSPVTRRR